MKTTVELPDTLVARAREVAARRHTSLRALVESGLRRELAEDEMQRQTYVLPDKSFGGNGLQPGVADLKRADLIEMTYGGRGA